ncbi:rhomboid family intramembrane serine protease [Aliamphritea hakodatensis]|uniref:rhomboid family intramembrane serine protease n=1 Tax=Aliamphritea hakodatensis TaxID=2895352 RepID=UPI0022FD4304|nr:rhomboid family intramembrane serine protease [Aliamphritea hakodatensis]
MVIIPTEKRFDWRKPPLILFCLVVTNVLVFFFYQDADEEKLNDVLSRYESTGYFAAEWPVYLSYLEETDSPEIATYRQLYEQEEQLQLSLYLLTDQTYFSYLRDHQAQFDEPGYGEYWPVREELNRLVSTISIYAYGLRPKSPDLTSLITYQFLHGGLLHLLGNMFFLVIFGFSVEAAVGHLRFLLFYLIAGVAGGVLYSAVNATSSTALVGASGAISGVMAMYLGVFRLRKIEFFYWFYIFVGFIRAPALAVLPLYLANEFYNFYTQPDSDVAFMAHTGGFLAGAVLIWITLLIAPRALDEQYLEQDEGLPERQKEQQRIYQLLGQFAYDAALRSIAAYEQKNGPEFDFCWLRYRIYKARGDVTSELQSAEQLLTFEHLTGGQLRKTEQVWNETPAVRDGLTATAVVGLGWRTMQLESLQMTEGIVKYLCDKDDHTQEMSHLARKLSQKFGEQAQEAKRKRYERVADEIVKRARQA